MGFHVVSQKEYVVASLLLSFPFNQSVIGGSHCNICYIFVSIARLVGFVIIELYSIPRVFSRLGPHQVLKVTVLPLELFLFFF